MHSPQPFFISGGTLAPDAVSYIAREADPLLLSALQAGAFCYVLDTRQVGKSSLMVRTRTRLEAQGNRTSILDLSAIGVSVTLEQWYYGLLLMLGKEQRCEEALDRFWRQNPQMGPLQRWMEALRQIVLPASELPLVLFVDEVDIVRSLPFANDEFFVGIRHCYNDRASNPALQRLTFCLLGSATPDQLIQDERTTPFNIGQRIELHDFTHAEAAALRVGLEAGEAAFRDGTALLDRVLYWTGGHPFLTQGLCAAIASDAGIVNAAGVDGLCASRFWEQAARSDNDILRSHLQQVSSNLLRRGIGEESDVTGLLEVYAAVYRGRHAVRDDAEDPLRVHLKLSGIVRSERSILQVRNRIYARVFDLKWVEESLPAAELRRQRRAFRAGMLRTLSLAGGVVVVMGGLLSWALGERYQTNQAKIAAESQAYRAGILLAGQMWEQRDYHRLRTVLQEIPARRPEAFERLLLEEASTQEDRVIPVQHPWAARYLNNAHWILCCSDLGALTVYEASSGNLLFSLPCPAPALPISVAISDDQRTLACGCTDGSVLFWDLATRKQFKHDGSLTGSCHALAFSPDGRYLAAGDLSGNVVLYDLTGTRVQSTKVESAIFALTFSPKDSHMVLGCSDGTLSVLTLPDLARRSHPKVATGIAHDLAFSPDGNILAVADHSGKVLVLKAAEPFDVLSPPMVVHGRDGNTSIPLKVTFAPDSRHLAVGCEFGVLKVYDIATGNGIAELEGQEFHSKSVQFAPDGRTLLTAGWDDAVRVWSLDRLPALQRVPLPFGQTAVTFADAGKSVVTATPFRGLFVSHLMSPTPTTQTLEAAETPQIPGSEKEGVLRSLAVDNAGQTVFSTLTPEVMCQRELRSGRILRTFPRAGKPLTWIALRPDGLQVATADWSGKIRIWDTGTGDLVQTLDQHRSPAFCVTWSPDGSRIASTSGTNPGLGKGDDTVRIWDGATFEQRAVFSGHSGRVYSAVFSREGSTLYTCGWDGTIRGWDVDSRKSLCILKAHRDIISCLALSPDGRRLASGGLDGSFKIWDVRKNGAPEEVFMQTHSDVGGVRGLCFSPDGMKLALVGDTGAVVLNGLRPHVPRIVPTD